MKKRIFILVLGLIYLIGCAQPERQMMEFKKLTLEEERVIDYKGTERPFTGRYNDFFEEGVYACKKCNAPLYKSSDKFKSECGWPSFDDEIPGAVKRTPDADGRRTEITCVRCGGHLGHVFIGERLTKKNTRHCVNSVSLQFIPSQPKSDTAIFAGGCFWGVEYYLQNAEGIISTEVGYIGGHTKMPTYPEVSSHTTGHAEAVRLTFDPSVITYEEIAKLFFEIHDPSQVNRQGPDIGDQYRSEVFYTSPQQKETAERLIGILKEKGYDVATKVTAASTFYKAEEYHQKYYNHKGSTPYCHSRTKRF